MAVPFIGIESIDEIISRVKAKELSKVSVDDQTVEGYVCTAYPMMYYRNHRRPIRFKLKVSDYDKYDYPPKRLRGRGN